MCVNLNTHIIYISYNLKEIKIITKAVFAGISGRARLHQTNLDKIFLHVLLQDLRGTCQSTCYQHVCNVFAIMNFAPLTWAEYELGT